METRTRPPQLMEPPPPPSGSEPGGGGEAGEEEAAVGEGGVPRPEETPPPLTGELLLLPPPPPPRGHCLLHNWQEERATNALDAAPPGVSSSSWLSSSGGFRHRHGHRGLLTLQWGASLAPRSATTAREAFRPPPAPHTAPPGRGQREAMMEWLLYQKYSKEVLEEEVDPPRGPMESLSTTHWDYHRGDFVSVPPAPTQPHNYRTEQPQSFWLEHALQVPGVSHIVTCNTPFRKNASFTTPVAEELDPPLPFGPGNYLKL